VEDPVRLLEDFDAAWNAHDEGAVLDFFIDDAVAKLVPPPPGEPAAYRGKEEIRSFVRRHMPGFHVDSRDHQAAGHQEEVGDRVIWEATVASDYFRRLGADEVEGTAEAIVKGGKIESYTFSLSQQTLASMQRAGGPA
jgi:ketosteroid isomerase-like protein